MTNTRRAARKVGTDGAFNRDTPAKGPRLTARGKERIQRGEGFMPEWTIARMDERANGLKGGKKTVPSARVERKESKTIAQMAKDLRRKPDTVRGWPGGGGPCDLADLAPPGRGPVVNRTMAETVYRMAKVRDHRAVML